MYNSYPLGKYKDLALLFLRVAIAAIFLYHGSQKFGFWSAAPEGMPANMVLLFKALAVIEPLAGLAVLLGIFSRGAALVLGVIMIGAIFMKIRVMQVGFAGQNGAGWEFDLVILAGCLMLVVDGPGKYALQKMMRGS